MSVSLCSMIYELCALLQIGKLKQVTWLLMSREGLWSVFFAHWVMQSLGSNLSVAFVKPPEIPENNMDFGSFLPDTVVIKWKLRAWHLEEHQLQKWKL